MACCVKHRRKYVLDAVLPTMAAKPDAIYKYLHGASATTVAALLPKLRVPLVSSTTKHGDIPARTTQWFPGLTIKWDRMWKFHATTYS